MFPDLTSSDLETSALVLLDLQHTLCLDDDPSDPSPLAAQVGERGVLPAVARTLSQARTGGLRILHVGVGIDESRATMNRTARFRRFADHGTFDLGSPRAAFVPEATPRVEEPVLTKSCVDPFAGTPLTSLLLGSGVRTLLFGGVATNFVVESAARHASDLGFQVWVLEDLCAAPKSSMHAFSVQQILPMCARVESSAAALGSLLP